MQKNDQIDPAEHSHIELKNKRDEIIVEIRKKKNRNQINQKRLKLMNSENSQMAKDQFESKKDKDFNPEEFFHTVAQKFIESFEQKDVQTLTQTAQSIRIAISYTDDPPLPLLISTKVVPFVIDIIDEKNYEFTQLINECAWIIANIASGATLYVNELVKFDILDKMIDLFKHPNHDIKDNAVWTLANIAGDSIEFRDQMISKGIVDSIVQMMSNNKFTIPFTRQVSWLISNITRGPPYPEFGELEPLFPLIKFFVKKLSKDSEIKTNMIWALSYLTNGNEEEIGKVMKLQVCSNICNIARENDDTTLAPALRTIGNILTENHEQTQTLIDLNVIDILAGLMHNSDDHIRKEIMWCFSNIMAGTREQLDEIIKYGTDHFLITRIIDTVQQDVFLVMKQALSALTNATYVASMEQIQVLVDHEILELFVHILQSENMPAEVILQVLNGIQNILHLVKETYNCKFDSNPYIHRIYACEGMKAIEQLQNHPDERVYKVVDFIITQHFEVLEEQ